MSQQKDTMEFLKSKALKKEFSEATFTVHSKAGQHYEVRIESFDEHGYLILRDAKGKLSLIPKSDVLMIEQN